MAQHARGSPGVIAELQHHLDCDPRDTSGLCAAVANAVATRIGDFASLWLPAGAGMSAVASSHQDPARGAVLAETLAGQVAAVGDDVGRSGPGRQDVERPEFAPYRRYADEFAVHALLAFPLRPRSRLLGALVVGRDVTAEPFSAEDLALLTEICAAAALALDNIRLSEHAQAEMERAERANALLHATESNNRELLDTSPSPVIVHRGGIFLYCNPAALALFGAGDLAQLVGQPILDRVHPADKEWVRQRTVAVESGVGIIDTARDLRLLRLDGTVFTAAPVALPRIWEGEPAVQATLQDVTDERRAAEALAARERFHKEVLDSLAPVLVLDAAGRVLAYNSAWAEHLRQIRAAELPAGADFIAACRAAQGERRARALALATGLERIIAGTSGEFMMDLEEEYADSTHRWLTVRAVPLFSAGGGVVMYLSDLTERKQLELELGRRATHDPLTGLPNRTLLQDRLELALKARSVHPVAVMFVDIDHFKQINDSYGHEVGDVALVNVAERLRAVIRPGDTVARLAGDEFVVVVEGLQRPEDILLLADRVLAALRSASGGPAAADLRLSASIGVAMARPGSRAGELIRSADTAMFEAKSQGGDCAVVFDAALSGRARARLETVNDLRRAVDRDELELAHQPILDLSRGTIDGAEALVHWRRPGHGLTPPAEFIAAAEESGLIVAVGEWVMAAGISWAAERLRSSAAPPLAVSVNVARRQLTHDGIVRSVEDALSASGLPAHLLTLEITESTLMRDPAAAVQVLDELKAVGVRLSMDDFGTGFSSLSYLHRFPFDELKIDRSFVERLGTDAVADAIVTSILALAHTLELSVVAEGVETAVQLDRLRELGCEKAQGLLIAPPQSAADFDSWLARGQWPTH